MAYAKFIETLTHWFRWRSAPRHEGGQRARRAPAPRRGSAASIAPNLPKAPVITAGDPSARRTTAPAQGQISRARALVLAVFNPSQPVEDRSQLLGRSAELNQLLGAMLDMRTHALVFGARGAGKTSLVRAFGDYADQRGHIVLYLSCGGICDFATIFAPYLDDLPDICFLPDEREEVRRLIANLPSDFGARALAAVLARVRQRDVIFVIDEFDRVTDAGTRAEIAALMKLLSDQRARVQLLFVGIARDVGELIGAHPSLRRHLVAVPLRRFDTSSMSDLFERGGRRTGLQFSPEARAMIAAMSVGSPYHLRLFCFCSAMAAIDRQVTTIGLAQSEAGLRFALEMWSSTNSADSALFARLAAGGAEIRRQLQQIATLSLSDDSLMPPHMPSGGSGEEIKDIQLARSEAFAMLRPALILADDGATYVFEDSLAPQFLLVTCHLAAPTRIVEAAEEDRTVECRA